MSSPEVPSKPPPTPAVKDGVPPAKPDAADNPNATTGTGSADLNYLQVLQEAGPIYQGMKASKFCPSGAIDLSACPYPGAEAPDKARSGYENTIGLANKFVGDFTGNKSNTALTDWIFGDDTNGVKHSKAGDTTIKALNADGLAVTADINKDKVTAGGDGWKVTHDKKTGASIYESAAFTATEKDGIKTIHDKVKGTTLQWDAKTKHGVVYGADGKVSFEFKSLSNLEEEIKARLTDDRYLHMLNGKHAYEQAVRDQLALRQKTPGADNKEQIYTDGNGNFSVITKAGLLYQYDKATNTTYLEQGNIRIRVKDGIAYSVQRDAATGFTTEQVVHDFKKYHMLGLQAVMDARGSFTAGQTNFNKVLGTLTTGSDHGAVTLSSTGGESTMTTPTGKLSLKPNGSITNTNPETAGVLGNYDKPTETLTGRTATGAHYLIKPGDTQLGEPNGTTTDMYDNGAVRTLDARGKELFNLDARGNMSIAGQFTVNAAGLVKHHGQNVGSIDNQGRSTGTAAWDEASGEIGGGSFGNLSLDNIGSVEGQLWNDYNTLSDLAARVTAKGNIPIAQIIMGKAASILEAIHKLDDQRAQLQNRPPLVAAAGQTGNGHQGNGSDADTRLADGTTGTAQTLAGETDAKVAHPQSVEPSPARVKTAALDLPNRIDTTGGMVATSPGADFTRTTEGSPGTVSLRDGRAAS